MSPWLPRLIIFVLYSDVFARVSRLKRFEVLNKVIQQSRAAGDDVYYSSSRRVAELPSYAREYDKVLVLGASVPRWWSNREKGRRREEERMVSMKMKIYFLVG